MIKLISFFFAAAILLSACTTRLTDFTVISSKNIDLSKVGDYKRGAERVVGEDLAHIIIFIPTGIPNLKEAIDKTIETKPGAVALVDGVISTRQFYIPLIYGQQAYVVEGTPLIDPKMAANEVDNTTDYMVSTVDEEGNVTTEFVTEDEWYRIKAEKFD